jgi:hypothetical protein
MNVQAGVALAALLVSMAALAVSSMLSWRQLRSLRSANHLPVAIDLLTRDMGSAEFHDQERMVIRRLADVPPDVPVSQLPEPLRGAAYAVSSFYDSMGILVAFGCIEERLVVATINYRVRRIWRVLESHIQAERKIRGALYLDFLEDLACRAHANDPLTLHAELGLRSMPHAQDSPGQAPQRRSYRTRHSPAVRPSLPD